MRLRMFISTPLRTAVSVMILFANGKHYGSGGANHADLKSNQPSVFMRTPRMLRCPWIISQWWISGTTV